MFEPTTTRSDSARCDLAAAMDSHEPLVAWVVRRQWLGPLSFAEALQAGRIGLWRALRHYEPTRGTRFSSYAVPAIAHAIWDEVARATPEPRLLPLEAADLITQSDLCAPLDHAQIRQTLDALLAQLPDRLRGVIASHYGWEGTPPQTFAQIGQVWGVSRQRIHQLHQQALLLLAQPARSHSLRRLVERQQRSDYHRTLARQRQHARAGRRGRR